MHEVKSSASRKDEILNDLKGTEQLQDNDAMSKNKEDNILQSKAGFSRKSIAQLAVSVELESQ